MRLQPYDSYQSLNIEWNQSAPSHWRSSRLKFDSYIKARVGWHGLKSDEFTEEGPFLITGSDFSGKVIDWSKCYHCDVERYEQDPYIQLKDEDLLITKDGTIGKVILTGKLPDKATLNSGVFVLRPLKEHYETKYYYWLMQSSVFHGFVEYYRTGSTISHLYQETFCNLPYALPSLEEQTQIVEFLDRETAKIDLLIEKQLRLIELLKEKRQAVISHAVTKGLNPHMTMKDSGVKWLGQVPEHWSCLPAKRIFRLATEPAPPNNDEELLSVYTDIGVRPRKDLEARGNKASTTDGYWRVKRGDLIVNKLLAWMGACGYSDYDGVTSPAYDILRPIKRINTKFYHYLFRSKIAQTEFKRWSRGIMEMRLRLYFDELGRIITPIPPEEEQNRIVNTIEAMEQKFDKLSSKASDAITLLQERRNALISAAVTGKIDVRDQVPQDVEEAVAS